MKKNQKLKISADKKAFSSEKKGFSLVETLIAIFIFSLVMAMLAGAFSGFLKKYVSAKKEQRSAESAQYVMNLMAKTIRTSTLDASSLTTSGQISMFDNSQGKCIIYVFIPASRKIQINTSAVVSDINQCPGAAWSGFSDLTSAGDVTGATFGGTRTIDKFIGKVTIVLSVPGNTPSTSSQIQTTVSLRQ